MQRRAMWSIALLVMAVLFVALPPISGAATSSSSPFHISGSGNTYQAVSQATSSSYSGSLKSVVEDAVDELQAGGGGEIVFLAGEFDLGPDWFELTDVSDLIFTGQGIDVTTIRNNAGASTDTEPFDFTRGDRITIRDMTVHADGPPRNTSDALDFDGGDDVVVERVKITGARGRGIIFDGKDSGQTATGNVVRDCIITGVPADGIQLLASSENLIEGCQITDVGGMGIRVTKSSTSADQANKKSNDNVISNNRINRSGSHGIGVRASDRNNISGNDVRNAQNGNSGILISEANGVDCDDNIVQLNTATDDQPQKTQEFGLSIADSECHRTVVIDNDFSGNLDGDIHDNGTNTIYASNDTEPPTTPTALAATSVGWNHVDIAWNASTDNVAVSAYDIYRDGGLLTSVSAANTSYSDQSVADQTSYRYEVRARDGAGNPSGLSGPLDVATPAPPPVLVFNPTDDATLRPNKGVLGSNATLEVDASSVKDMILRFEVSGTSGSSVTSAVLRLHAVNGSNVGGDFSATTTGWSESSVTWENAPAGGTPLGSLGAVSAGNWYELDVTPLVVGDGPVSLRADSSSPNGADYVSSEGSSALRPELVVELDEASPTDDEAPSAPAGLAASDVQPSSVSMAWGPSTDNVGVVAYDVHRDGSLLGSVGGATLGFTDSTVVPDMSYRYELYARDAAGNTSGVSNPLDVTTPSQPSVLVLSPTDDATVRQNRPDRNLGTDTSLEVDASSLKNVLLRFELTTTGAATVVSATLRLHAIDGSSHGGTFTSTIDTGWSEDTVTWNNAPAADGIALGSWGSVDAGNWYELDVTPLVTGDGVYSIRMTSPDDNGADYVSKEGASDLTPQLVLVLG